MANTAQELFHALKTIANPKPDEKIVIGIVKACNSDDTIDVEAHGVIFFDVRLKAAVKPQLQGIRIKPAIGSVVIIQKIGRDDISTKYQVVMFSEVEEYSIEINTVKLLIDGNGFNLQKGNDSLKEIMSDLISEILKIYAPMNKPAITLIKERANQLLQ